MERKIYNFHSKNKSSSLNILITGASGFIGKNLIPILLKKNNITVIVRNKKKIEYQDWYKKVVILETDISRKKIFSNKSYDVLIHLAWENLNNHNSIKHLKNLKKHKNFIETALKNNIKRFIVAGTCQEYGLREGKLNERMKVSPTTPYSKSKNELRKFIFSKKNKYNITIQWLRIFYIYGRYQSKNTLFGQIDETIKKRKKIFNMSSGQQIRDYLPIKNLCIIIKLLVDNPKVTGIINGCSGKKLKLINIINKYIGNTKINLNKNYYKKPKHEPINFWGCCKKLNKLFK